MSGLIHHATAQRFMSKLSDGSVDLIYTDPPFGTGDTQTMTRKRGGKTISKIEEAILSALEMTPPELSADIYKTGIYLAGGGSMLRGLDKRIQAKTKLPVHIAEDPLRAVARGTSIALKNIDKYPFLMGR